MTAPRTPPGLRAGGQRLWRSIVEDYELGQHELAVLVEACHTVDACHALEAIVTAEGVVHDSPQGKRAHPALVEARQQRLALAKLVASLRIPLDDQQAAGRQPQQRVGIRPVSLAAGGRG
ncbi:hypothetical protein [Tessaracoccus sp. Z1128]